MSKTFKRIVTLLLALVTVLALMPATQAEAAALKQGSSGSQVKQLQQNLIGLGYLSGSADGSFGAKTKEAVKKFQSAYGLSADGSAGEATQTAVRNAIVRLQVELKNAGYAPGSADGHFGAKTKKALQAFQKDKDLDATGVADKATWSAINSRSGGLKAGSAVKKGSSGTQVKQLQQALIGLGYLTGSADGQYGAKTAEAVKKYQRAYDLSADGSAGANTMTSLKNTVVTLQSDLARKGYYTSAIDGSFGGGTKNAVKAYQKAVGVAVTGVAGPKTMEKLYGYCLGGSEGESVGKDKDTYKIWIDSLYQDTDHSKIWYYNGGKKSTTVSKSGCAGVSTAMALNAMLDTNEYTGQNVMQWFADHGYYLGSGTYHNGVLKYPRTLGLDTTFCSKAGTLIGHLKKGRLAVVLIKDRTGKATFTYSGGGGHYVLVSGYREKDGVDQVFVNNPLSYKASQWYDLKDLTSNWIHRSDFEPCVIIYK